MNNIEFVVLHKHLHWDNVLYYRTYHSIRYLLNQLGSKAGQNSKVSNSSFSKFQKLVILSTDEIKF